MSDHPRVPVISVVGKSGVGKTMALVCVIRELKKRGYRLGTVRHDPHDFEVDKPGKDTCRQAQAGSDVVVVSGPQKMAMSRRVDEETPVDEIVGLMGNVDLVITEGSKRGGQAQDRNYPPGARDGNALSARRTGMYHG